MKEFIDKTPTQSGTPINREALMAIQGFDEKEIIFKTDGSVVERNAQGHTKTTTFDEDGNIIEIFVGEKTISKKTIFNANGSVSEVLL